jgi:hypothetical protein
MTMAGLPPGGVVWASKLEWAGLDRSFGGVPLKWGQWFELRGRTRSLGPWVLGSNC